MNSNSYYQQKKITDTKRLRELTAVLPPYVKTFFRGIDQTTASRTKIAYAVDLKVFFEYIKHSNPLFKNADLKDIPFELIKELKAMDIEEYVEYLKLYENEEGKEIMNDERGVKRKLSSLRSFYGYFHKNQLIENNPVIQVSMPKLHDKAIVRLDADEVSELLDVVESGDRLSKNQQKYHDKLKTRDLALLTLMLGTGIRVSECVGLNINDIDFHNNRILVTRKGGYESYVYFGAEVETALLDYLVEREVIEAADGHEDALFLSSRKQRISVRNVEVLVKKYARTVTTMKKITPHKLRSTYGTSLYQQTNDIYLVADVLGHKDVNTTRKHYADMGEERKRNARDAVKLRK